MICRRSFLGLAATAVASAALTPSVFGKSLERRIKLGFDNFALRALGWKAGRLLDHAAELKCDALFISDLDSYESLEDAALREVRQKAEGLGIALYAGGWSICPTSVRFKKNWGTAEEHLLTGIRVAKTLGSPVYRVVLGVGEDRKTEGGISARIVDTVKVLKACRQQALDAGVKIAVENHGGDLHSWELVRLIEESGPDFVGANIDSGNATWTLEDPLDVLENLGKYVICSSLRDSMIWETPKGAAIAWTAAGEGLMDWKRYVERWRELCPSAPIFVETISGFSREFPYRQEEFWKDYDKHPEALAHFEALAKRGHSIAPFKAPEGVDAKVAEQEFQKGELARSLAFLRQVISNQ